MIIYIHIYIFFLFFREWTCSIWVDSEGPHSTNWFRLTVDVIVRCEGVVMNGGRCAVTASVDDGVYNKRHV